MPIVIENVIGMKFAGRHSCATRTNSDLGKNTIRLVWECQIPSCSLTKKILWISLYTLLESLSSIVDRRSFEDRLPLSSRHTASRFFPVER